MATTLKDPTSRRRRKTSVKPSSNGNGKGTSNVERRTLNVEGGNGKAEAYSAEMAIASIGVGPFNPRSEFRPEALADLAKSIGEHGLLEPLLVRAARQPAATEYELVAGERRLRAAKLAGLESVPVRVMALSDREAREVAAIENLQREDLSAVEEARAFQSLLEGDDAPSQRQVAARLGVSQSHIANRLRLLELPEAVQARVISQEISATHARELCRYKDYPELVQTLAKELLEDIGSHGEPPTVSRFRDYVFHGVRDYGRQLQGQEWDKSCHQSIPYFKPTDAEREQLGVVEVEVPWSGAKIDVAMNAALWDSLQEKHKTAWLAKQAKRNAKPAKAAAKKPPEKMTAAEKARAEKEEAARAAEQARQFARRLWEWRIDWQRDLISVSIRSWVEDADLLRLALVAAVNRWHVQLGGKIRTAGDDWGAIAKAEDPDGLARDALAACFCSDSNEPCKAVSELEVEAIAKYLKIDLSDAWTQEQAGPLSEAYWNLHTKEQLAALAAELFAAAAKKEPAFVAPPLPAKKSELVALLLSFRPAPDSIERGVLPLPKELKKAKRPKLW